MEENDHGSVEHHPSFSGNGGRHSGKISEEEYMRDILDTGFKVIMD